MVCRLLILFMTLVCITSTSYGNIVYEKNNLIITTIDINTYKRLYEKNYGLTINNNNALKDLVLINNLMKSLENNNKEFLDQIDEVIITQYKNISLNNLNVKYFYRFLKIKNEFTIDYFQNKLVVEEIYMIFSKLDKLDLPISKNKCLIIDKIIDLKNNKNFILNLFNNIKTNSNNFNVLINDEKYRVCIDEKKYRSIEQLIIDYIQTQIKVDFEYFVYDKTKN